MLKSQAKQARVWKAGALALLAMTNVGQQPATAKQMWAKSFLGKKAPALIVEKWISKQPNLKGKYVLIDFWATWCPPCREAVTELNRIHQKFGKKLVVIGLSEENEKTVRAMSNPSLKYFSAIDSKGRTKKQVGVTGIPHVMIIDPKGIVRWEGFPLLEGYKLDEKVVAQILQGKLLPSKAPPQHLGAFGA